MRNHSHSRSPVKPPNIEGHVLKPVNSPVIEPKANLALVANLANEPRVHHLKAPGEQRLKAQNFIKGIFKEHHQAKVSSFLPSLFAIFNPQGETQSALGVRNAAQDKLYLEQYLDSSIDQLLENLLGEAVQRREVVEIGNLASQNSASCKALFAHITQCLQDQNVKWITCTGTATLRVVFKRLGIKAIPIHKADQDRLGEEQYAWGNYYQNDPQVMLINVRETNQHFINQKKAAQKLSATH